MALRSYMPNYPAGVFEHAQLDRSLWANAAAWSHLGGREGFGEGVPVGRQV